MNSQEHFDAAEKLLKRAQWGLDKSGVPYSRVSTIAQMAQVHATLALSAPKPHRPVQLHERMPG